MKHGASITGASALYAKLDKITAPSGSVPGLNVGIVKSAKYPIGKNKGRIQGTKAPSVAQVAMWNEFGTSKIPSRPFMRNSIKDWQTSDEVKKTLRQVIDPTNPAFTAQAANKLGAQLVGLMQLAMKDPDFPPNAPFTKLQKGGSEGADTTPLIDTGLLRRSIDHAIGGPDGDST